MDSHITMQKMFAHAAKGAQEIAQPRPQPFAGVGVGLKPTITIIVTRPLVNAMTHRFAVSLQVVVTLVLVGIHQRLGMGELLDKRTQGGHARIVHHAQAHLSTFTSDHAQHWRTVIGKRAASASLVGMSTRRVKWVEMLKPF